MKKNYNKILFCASFTPPVNAGGGKNAYYFGRFLSGKGRQITLLSLNRKGKDKFRERVNGMQIIRLLYLNHTLITKLLSLLAIIPGYAWHVYKNEIVFIYGGNMIGFESIIFFSWMFGKTVVFRSTMYLEDDMNTLMKRPMGGLRKWIMRRLSFYFSLNPAFTSAWMAQIGDREKVFESVQGVDTSVFTPVEDKVKEMLRNRLKLPTDSMIIISVGYVLRRKGFHHIFKSLSDLKKPFLYLVVGNYSVSKDHYLNKFRDEMNTLYQMGMEELDGKVLFVGPNDNVQEYLQAADVFLLCSRREGFPNALLEAMSCGLPCVMRDLPGHYDLIARDRENMILLGDPQELKPVLSNVLEEAGLRKSLGLEARKTIIERGSFEGLWLQIQGKLAGLR